MAVLNIVRGIPGAGKSTYARTKFPNMMLLETDMFMYQNGEYNFDYDKHREVIDCIEEFRDQCMDQFQCDLCLTGVFSSTRSLIGHIIAAVDNNYDMNVVTLYTQFNGLHNVPEDVVQNFKDHFVSSLQVKEECEKTFAHYTGRFHFTDILTPDWIKTV